MHFGRSTTVYFCKQHRGFYLSAKGKKKAKKMTLISLLMCCRRCSYWVSVTQVLASLSLRVISLDPAPSSSSE